MNLHRVELDADAKNERALHVYEKIGFVREGLRRQSKWIAGEWHDLVVMGILREEFESQRE